MNQRECGVPPAELNPEESWRRPLYPDLIQMRDRLLKERGLEITHAFTSTFIVDQKGKPRIFREYRGELVMHSFDSLPDAIDQIERVIQQKFGFQKRIGGILIDIAGENAELGKIGSMLLFGADRYYEIPLVARKAYSKSLAEETIPYLENKHNVYKKAAGEVLKIILDSDDEFKDDAQELIKAGKDAFDAAISGIRIVSGETVRLIAGQYYFELWGNQSLKIFEKLARFHEQLVSLNEATGKGKFRERREKFATKMAEKFKEQGSFWEAIGKIKANPFFKRFNSPPVKKLIRLPWALTTNRFELAERLLASAAKQLSAVERDFERGKIRLLQPKSTSRP